MRGGAIVAAALSALSHSAFAQEHCRLEPPTRAGGQLKIKLTCHDNADAQTVRYPAGPLHVGVSLYKLPGSLGQVIAPFQDEGESGALHLDAQEIRRPRGSNELTFRMPANVSQTHVLVAVWDQKNSCTPRTSTYCGPSRQTFGKVDRYQQPVPVDAWPIPICDVAALQARGYFKWSATADWGAPSEDEEMMTLARLNDCWMQDPQWPGRGLSYRQWRVAPLPR